MSAATIPALDTWGDEPQRRAPVPTTPARPYGGALDFLWALGDVMADEPLYVGDISRRLKLTSCAQRVSKSGAIYATLKALMKLGMVAYDTDGRTQGKYRITPAGLAHIERSPEALADRALYRLERECAEVERRIHASRAWTAHLEAELAGLRAKMEDL